MTEFGVLCFAGAMGRGSADEGLTYELAVRVAEAAEKSGYDTFLMPDEMFITRSPLVECWTTLAGIAERTSRLNIGPYVTCNSYRHPAVLAKIASTVDVMSGGRLRFHLGACGWGQEVVHNAYGIPYGNLAERVARLKEAIQVIREMWSKNEASFQGEYYWLKAAICEPKPIQSPLPIWTGGSSDTLIRTAAMVADGWDTGFCTFEGFKRLCAKLDRECERIDRDPGAVRRSMHWHTTLIGRDEEEVKKKKAKFIPPILDAKSKHPTRWIREMTDEEYVARRFLIGTPDECVETIAAYLDYGCDSLNFVFPDASEIEPILVFAEGVISKFT